MIFKQLNFYNYPRKISLEPYRNAREELIKYFKKFENVLAIYEYGKVAAPGVSDLDIIIVFNEAGIFDQHDSNFSVETNALIGSGNIIYIDKLSFSKLFFIEDLQINLLYGEQIRLEYPSDIQKFYINLVSILDWIPERCSRLQNYINNKNIDVVTCLCVLNSLLYSFDKANLFYIFDTQNFKEKLNNLRLNYFAFTNPDFELYQLITTSIKLSNDLIDLHLSFLVSKNIFYGTSDQNKSNYLELYLMKQIGFNEPTTLFNLPYDLYFHYLSYGLINNYLSKKFKQKFNKDTEVDFPDVPFSEQYKEAQKNKISICSQNANYLLKNNIKKGLIRFGYLL